MKKPEHRHIYSPRFKATYKGEAVGWYNTVEEAYAVIESIKKEEKKEAEAFRDWLWKR